MTPLKTRILGTLAVLAAGIGFALIIGITLAVVTVALSMIGT